MDAAELERLLSDIKTRLNITWEDEHTDNRMRGILLDGMAYLDKRRGAPADYTAYGYPRQLLFEYCRYARDEALDIFENNYQSLILSMRDERRVEVYDAAQQAAEAGA